MCGGVHAFMHVDACVRCVSVYVRCVSVCVCVRVFICVCMCSSHTVFPKHYITFQSEFSIGYMITSSFANDSAIPIMRE